MGPLDYLMLLVTIVLIVELVTEVRRKRWPAAILSLLFLILVTWIARGIYVSLWKSITGTP